MALSFTGTSLPDFLPTEEENEIYREKLKRHSESSSPSKKLRTIDHRWHWDDWDRLGRNLTEAEKRQAKVPWIKVRYVRGKLYIPPDKKEILRSLNLL